jgi:hypothetical protein
LQSEPFGIAIPLATLTTFLFLEVIFLVVQMTTELGNLILGPGSSGAKMILTNMKIH